MNAVAVSGTTVYRSNPIDTALCVAGSVQIVSTGTATGAAKLQASNDECPAGNLPKNFVPANWTDIPSATVSVTGAGTFLIPKIDLSYRWVAVVYTNATNTGNVSAQFNGIGF